MMEHADYDEALSCASPAYRTLVFHVVYGYKAVQSAVDVLYKGGHRQHGHALEDHHRQHARPAQQGHRGAGLEPGP